MIDDLAEIVKACRYKAGATFALSARKWYNSRTCSQRSAVMGADNIPHTPDSAGTSAEPPSSVWRRSLQRAERQVGHGEYTAAIRSLERAISAGANAYNCTVRIADLYRRLHNRAAAREAAERAVALSPRQSDAYELLLDMAIERGDNAEAAWASQAIIKVEPCHIQAHNALGAAYMQVGQVAAAMRVVSTLIRLDPRNAMHRFKKGLLCQHMGEVALAVHEFVEALKLEPEGPFVPAVREALETLDIHQLNQIVALAVDDTVFRGNLERDPESAIEGRGYALSPLGMALLTEFCLDGLQELPAPPHTVQYH
jgi:Tfp pilus assembly protein PilF